MIGQLLNWKKCVHKNTSFKKLHVICYSWKSTIFSVSCFTNNFYMNIKLLSLRLEGVETLKYCCVCRPPCGKVTTMDARTRAIFPFSIWNTLFGQIWSKENIKIVSFSWNLVPRLIQIWRILVFTFSILGRKHPFSVNLVQKLNMVSLSWNLVPTILFIIFFNFKMF